MTVIISQNFPFFYNFLSCELCSVGGLASVRSPGGAGTGRVGARRTRADSEQKSLLRSLFPRHSTLSDLEKVQRGTTEQILRSAF